MPPMEASLSRPRVVLGDLSGFVGNGLCIIGRCRTAALTAGWDPDSWARFLDRLLRTQSYEAILETIGTDFEVVGDLSGWVQIIDDKDRIEP